MTFLNVLVVVYLKSNNRKYNQQKSGTIMKDMRVLASRI